MPESEPHILFETRGALGLVTLNRPKALNALTHGMCMGLHRQLDKWAADPAIAAVVVRGAGPKAFCAGGDIRALWESATGRTKSAAGFFADEYRLNAAVARFPKPYIALWHGYVMGGGAGVSVHGRYRLADSSLVFAMPETAIGFIPDIGSSYFLSRMPDETGMYLGLTGERIGLGDALAMGLMTHAVAKIAFDAVIENLAQGRQVQDAIAPFVTKIAPGPLAAHRRRIATIFSAASVEAILERLDRDGSDFALATAQVIRMRSPTSLKLVFRQLREARSLDLRQCLAMELRLAVRVLKDHDFREGVRAALVDKDRNPKWQPSSLAGVGNLDPFFASLGAMELF